MHPSDQKWWLQHSGDYVLGLLSNPDRLVFERIMQVDPDVAALVDDWREQLYPMADALPPLDPPAHILESLASNLPPQPNPRSNAQTNRQAVNAANNADPETRKLAESQAEVLADGTAFQRLLENKQQRLDINERSANGWRNYAGLATVACIATGVLAWLGYQGLAANGKGGEQAATATQFDAISVVEDTSAKPLWIVDSLSEQKLLRITAISPPELEQGKAFELWINNQDRTVASMGLLPTVANESVLINANDFNAAAIAYSVSVESEGGSATELPTSPVMYRGLIEPLSTVTP